MNGKTCYPEKISKNISYFFLFLSRMLSVQVNRYPGRFVAILIEGNNFCTLKVAAIIFKTVILQRESASQTGI